MADTPGGFLIIFDGIDGVGKSTQLQQAEKALSSQGFGTYVTRNLGGTPIGDELRKVIKMPLERPPKTNLYISVAIQEALVEEVARLRAENKLILMDRGPMSLAAYEIYGSGLDGDLAWPHVDAGMRRLAPDLVIIYKADIEAAVKRARSESGDKDDYFENKSLEYFQRVALGYEECAKRYPKTIVIDADNSIETVHELTMKATEEALSKRS